MQKPLSQHTMFKSMSQSAYKTNPRSTPTNLQQNSLGLKITSAKPNQRTDNRSVSPANKLPGEYTRTS